MRLGVNKHELVLTLSSLLSTGAGGGSLVLV